MEDEPREEEDEDRAYERWRDDQVLEKYKEEYEKRHKRRSGRLVISLDGIRHPGRRLAYRRAIQPRI
jgi:hypothetical protein